MDLTLDEINKLVELLHKLRPGFLPKEIFFEIIRLIPAAIVDIVPLIEINNELQVLLIERESDDPFFGGQVHIPGTSLRSTDAKGNFKSAFDRIIQGELKGVSVISEPVFCGSSFHDTTRGSELTLIHWVLVDQTINIGKFYLVNDLPSNIVPHQKNTIGIAVENYRKSKTNV